MTFTLLLLVWVEGLTIEVVLADNLSAIECEEKAIQLESLMEPGIYQLVCAI